jgi:DNA-binding NtrC family response regulator
MNPNKSILIVDDEVDICSMMAFMFETEGYQVAIAHNAREAFTLVQQQSFDVVVSDIRMPFGGGIKLLKDIKGMNPTVPRVILSTGFSDVPTEEALKLGAEKILSKPIRLKDLLEEVEMIVYGKTA